MSPVLFWIFASLMLVFGAAVVVNRNPVASALSLVVSFIGLAALFMSLDAYFLGIIQVLVYAGAVMVLFLFIIMLLNIRAEERRRINWVTSAAGIAVALAFLIQIFLVITRFHLAAKTFPPLPSSPTTFEMSARRFSRITICRFNWSVFSCLWQLLASCF